MEELDYDFGIHNAAQAEADKTLAVKFYTQAIQNDEKTLEAGRPIFEDTEMVEIRVRGDRNNIVQRPVREEDKRRFRGAFQAYKSGQGAMAEGTPLSEWPIASASFVEEMKYLGFFTVEQLAQANDSAASKFPGLEGMRQKAKLFLEFSKGLEPMAKLEQQVSDLANQNEVATRQFNEMKEMLEKAEARNKELMERLTSAPAPVAPPAPQSNKAATR